MEPVSPALLGIEMCVETTAATHPTLAILILCALSRENNPLGRKYKVFSVCLANTSKVRISSINEIIFRNVLEVSVEFVVFDVAKSVLVTYCKCQ